MGTMPHQQRLAINVLLLGYRESGARKLNDFPGGRHSSEHNRCSGSRASADPEYPSFPSRYILHGKRAGSVRSEFCLHAILLACIRLEATAAKRYTPPPFRPRER